ncbi:MAG TPA: TIR domain-containing protein, partial [Pirellulales bacterium]|nr:TIR domain-containing protein [Pirellulales bacterium]
RATMATASKVCDVYVSHALRDASLAEEVVSSVRAVGLEPASSMDFSASAEASDALWDALAECRAFIAVVSPTGLTASTGFELGAAQSWNKPVFALMTDASGKPPAALSRAAVYSPASIDEVVKAIQAIGEPLSDKDRCLLIDIYGRMKMPLDKLVLEPRYADQLVRQFKSRSHRSISGERLLSELLRMRKRGILKRHGRASTD